VSDEELAREDLERLQVMASGSFILDRPSAHERLLARCILRTIRGDWPETARTDGPKDVEGQS
jgi:hypothetical protein